MNFSKTTASAEQDADLAALRDDVTALKRDLAAALEHLKGYADKTAESAADRVADTASDLFEALSSQNEKTVKSLGARIEQQPITSVLIAFAVGYVIGRFLPARGGAGHDK